MCGKTFMIKQLLLNRNKLISPAPKKVYFFYAVWQKEFEDIQDFTTFIKDVPSVKSLPEDCENSLIVLDDLYELIDKECLALFTKHSHHRGLSIIFLTQAFFNKNKFTREITLNCSHIIWFKNPRDKKNIQYLSYQVFPGKGNFLLNVFEHCTKEPYSFLLIDLSAECPDENRVVSRIFDQYPTVYVCGE
jgi:hypothetical protein